MKVVVYGARDRGGWMFRFSMAWEVDRRYWLAQGATEMVRIVEPLPLGLAEQICERLVMEPYKEWDSRRAGETLSGVARTLGCSKAFARRVEWVGADGSQPAEDERIAMLAREAGERLAGRSLLEPEAAQLLGEAQLPTIRAALQLAALAGAVRLTAAVAPHSAAMPRRGWGWLRAFRRRSAAELRCRRCGNAMLRRTPCAACGEHACAYCEACLTMGRSRACGLLVIGAAPRASGAPLAVTPADPLGRWRLSPAQREAAAAALHYLAARRRERAPGAFLLWAVTGAGKTEMIFPLLEAVLSRGGRALVATPRRDVVLELAPRLAAAFPSYSRAVLYGGSADRWENAALTLATTHQLIRFQDAFDLVLIDEMDAFPYRDNAMLQFAAAKCCRSSGATLYLSATPPADMQRAVASGRIACARVPVRFHGHPLPVPRGLRVPPLSRWIEQHKLPPRIIKHLRESILRGAQLFVFVPLIRHVDPLVRLLRQVGPGLGLTDEAQIEGTSSKDALRADNVSRFRERVIRVLVTTTILERGVTIPKSDVFVLDADDARFDEAALVQMAGRAGRSAADPNGFVIFAATDMTSPQRRAIQHIRSMNRIARRRGFLHAPRMEASAP